MASGIYAAAVKQESIRETEGLIAEVLSSGKEATTAEVKAARAAVAAKAIADPNDAEDNAAIAEVFAAVTAKAKELLEDEPVEIRQVVKLQLETVLAAVNWDS